MYMYMHMYNIYHRLTWRMHAQYGLPEVRDSQHSSVDDLNIGEIGECYLDVSCRESGLRSKRG